MCGINGIFAYRECAPPVDEAELLRTREAMIRRGPDGAGLWVSPDRRVGLAHRRLAIIDLSEAGAQPMATADGRLRITFNGEIYNYRELRRQLEAKGCVFRSQSDTEVLLHLYDDCGAEMVHALRGMFAFAIWDEPRRTLFMARDPLGIKPLYVADDGRTIRFASQVKALVKSAAVGLEGDPAGEAGYYVWGYVPEPHSLYRSIRAIPAGNTLVARAGGDAVVRPYFRLADEIARAEEESGRLGRDEMAQRLSAALEDSVRHHLVADVPVGVFLSAGLDSSAILALASRSARHDLKAFTLGFDEYRGGPHDEVPMAARIAARYGVEHESRWTAAPQFEEALHDFLEAMDQPSIDGLNTYLVSRAAASSGLRVALSGLGADELFRGYSSFRDVPRLVRWLGWSRRMPSGGRAMRRLATPVLGRLASPKYAGLLEYGGSISGAYLLRRGLFMPWELPGLMGRQAAADGWGELDALSRLETDAAPVRNDHLRVSALEMSWYMRNQLLRDADWAGMAHSLEIRVPFVDVTLLRALLPLLAQPSPPGKRDVALAADPAFPGEALERPKTGFTVPVQDWLVARAGGRSERGMRGWARKVGRRQSRASRVLVLTTEAFGGHGGIALYNRDLLSSLASHDGCREVVALPRLMSDVPEALPPRIAYVMDGIGGKLSYLRAVWRLLRADRRFDLVVCGHVNLSPVAWLAAKACRAPMLLCLYGIDARKPAGATAAGWFARRAHAYVSISGHTLARWLEWTHVDPARAMVVPNAIHLDWYRPGGKPGYLVERYGLAGRTIIMTLGRLDARERYKGVDEVLDAMPALAGAVPGIAYLIVGDGSDRQRLERRVRDEGLAHRVVFAGRIAETEKADHYRVADAFVLPSHGEGFGFVLLEAMACGIPVLGSRIDGGREALRDGQLGRLVDPGNGQDVLEGILDVLARKGRQVPQGLEHFSYAHFERRWHEVIDGMMA